MRWTFLLPPTKRHARRVHRDVATATTAIESPRAIGVSYSGIYTLHEVRRVRYSLAEYTPAGSRRESRGRAGAPPRADEYRVEASDNRSMTVPADPTNAIQHDLDPELPERVDLILTIAFGRRNSGCRTPEHRRRCGRPRRPSRGSPSWRARPPRKSAGPEPMIAPRPLSARSRPGSRAVPAPVRSPRRPLELSYRHRFTLLVSTQSFSHCSSCGQTARIRR